MQCDKVAGIIDWFVSHRFVMLSRVFPRLEKNLAKTIGLVRQICLFTFFDKIITIALFSLRDCP